MGKLKELLELNVNTFTEKKNGLTYLSWATAWKEFIKIYPNAVYEVKKNNDGLPTFGNEKQGYMVYTTVTVEDLTHEMWLPVLDFRNKAMTNPTMFDVNKSVMRCLTKNLAMFGLGLYIYAGEDLPNESDQQQNRPNVNNDIKQQILNRLSTLTEEEKSGYRTEVAAGNWSFNQEFLTHLTNKYGSK